MKYYSDKIEVKTVVLILVAVLLVFTARAYGYGPNLEPGTYPKSYIEWLVDFYYGRRYEGPTGLGDTEHLRQDGTHPGSGAPDVLALMVT